MTNHESVRNRIVLERSVSWTSEHEVVERNEGKSQCWKRERESGELYERESYMWKNQNHKLINWSRNESYSNFKLPWLWFFLFQRERLRLLLERERKKERERERLVSISFQNHSASPPPSSSNFASLIGIHSCGSKKETEGGEGRRRDETKKLNPTPPVWSVNLIHAAGDGESEFFIRRENFETEREGKKERERESKK